MENVIYLIGLALLGYFIWQENQPDSVEADIRHVKAAEEAVEKAIKTGDFELYRKRISHLGLIFDKGLT